MLIKNLKKYPKQSQLGSNISNILGNAQGIVHQAVSNAVQENLYTAGGEYELPDGTEFIGDYHIHPVQGPMVGATHSRGAHASLTSINTLSSNRPIIPVNTNRPTTTVGGALVGRSNTGMAPPPPIAPTMLSDLEYEKYRVSGSVYKSNIKSFNDRDLKGNIQLNESASLISGNINEKLVFEPISNNFTNRSVLSAIDTQFTFFKFPAQISTTVQDLEFDESTLDIDVQASILSDPYQGKLIRNQADFSKGLYLVQGTGKRKFEIRANSIWALKNNLNPFSNINDNIDGKDAGQRNDTGDDGVLDNTFLNVSPGIFDGYEILDPYYPEDAFAEGNVYGKIQVTLTERYTGLPLPTQPSPKYAIEIIGSSFGKIEYSDIKPDTFNPSDVDSVRRNKTTRLAEFDIDEMLNSTIQINGNLPDDSSFTGTYNDSYANYLSNNVSIDLTNGSSYLNFVQNAFRNFVAGNSQGWDIQQIAKRDIKPKNFLDGLKSPGDPSGNSGWGGNVTYYRIQSGRLDEEDEKTRLYRLRIPIPSTALTNNGYSYRIYENNTDITNLLLTSTGIRAKTHENIAANSGVPFEDTTNPSNDRNGFSLDMNEVFPNNSFPKNSTRNIEIEIDTFAPAGNTVDLSFIFVGLNRWANGTSNSVGSDIPTTSIQVVPNTILFETPSSGDQMWNSNTQDYSRNYDRVDNLKNWKGYNNDGGQYLETNWNSSTNIRKVPNGNGVYYGFIN